MRRGVRGRRGRLLPRQLRGLTRRRYLARRPHTRATRTTHRPDDAPGMEPHGPDPLHVHLISPTFTFI